MASTPKVDFGLRSADYAEHRPGLPGSFYDRLERFVQRWPWFDSSSSSATTSRARSPM